MNGGAVMIWMVSFALSLVLAPLLPGIVNKVKAFFAGRRGPSLFQLYVDLAKLLRKEGVFSATAGGFLQLAPSVSLGSLLLAAALLPHGLVRSPLGATAAITSRLTLPARTRPRWWSVWLPPISVRPGAENSAAWL